MRWVKKIVCVFLGLSMIVSPVFADIPDKTVIIGNEAFNLHYANDMQNVSKIRAALAKNTGEIIIKSRNAWYENSGQVFKSVDSLPGVIYTDDNGRVHEYREQNGDKIQGRVLTVGIQDKNSLRIVLNQRPDNEWISNKENFIIGNRALTDEDEVTYNEECGFIEIKLHEDMKFQDPINVSLKNVTNKYGEVLYQEFEESIFVIDSEEKQGELKDFKGIVSIIGKDMEISLEDANGSVYVSGSNVTIKNYYSDKDIVISDSTEGLTFYKVKCPNILSFARGEVKFSQSEIDELVTGNVNSGDIVAKDSKIAEIRILGDITVESINAFISNVKILAETQVKFKGEFNEVNVLHNANVELLKNSKIKKSLNVYSSIVLNTADSAEVGELNLSGYNSKSIISGNIKTLNIKTAVELDLKDAHIRKIELLCDGTTINTDKKTTVETFNKNNHEFSGEIVIKSTTEPSSGGSSNGGSSNGGSSNGGSSNGDNSNDTIKVKSIILNKTECKMELPSEDQLIAEVVPNNATNKTLTWKSSDSSIVTVDQNGKVVARGVGTAIITVEGSNDKSAICNVTVVNDYIEVEEINLNKNEIEIELSEEFQLISEILPTNATDKTLAWKSSDTDVATVDQNGKVVATGVGTAIITVEGANGKIAKCNVTVLSIAVNTITLLETKNIELGEEAQLIPKIYPSNATDKTLKWVSSDDSIVSVSDNGIITGNALGVAEVSAITTNGKVASCIVTVIPEFIDVFVDKVNGKAVITIPDITENEQTMIIKIMNTKNGNLELIQEYTLTSDIMEIELELDQGVYNGGIYINNSRRFNIKTFNIE